MKKLHATILYLAVFGGIMFPFGFVRAYEVGTHAFLTGEIFNFYNKNFENKIPDEFKGGMIQGSIDEDQEPRWMNHFYDPVYNRGLTMDSGTFSPEDMAAVSLVNAATFHSNWLSSKNWSQNSDEQTSRIYNRVLNTTIAGLLAVTNPAALETTDYSLERAVRDYVQGDKERAFRGLGHILHLIEDASVPDHTRNDPHPAFNSEDAFETGSPYELWTGKFNLENPDKDLSVRLLNKKPIISADLNSYFDGMANYSNNNFYSRDTVGIGKYNSPEPDYFGNDGYYTYGFKQDLVLGDYHLLAYENPPSKYGWVVNKKENLIFKEKIGSLNVLPDYWNRLSVKAVQNGAGVVDLFFKEVEKAKNDPNFIKAPSKSFVAQVVDLLTGFFVSNSDSGLKLSATMDLDDKKSDVINSKSPVVATKKSEAPKTQIVNGELVNIQDFNGDTQNEDALQVVKFEDPAEADQVAGQSAPAVEKKPVKSCSFATDKTPNRQKLLINEVAWMGTQNSANDEWIELKNISGAQLDISGWQILDKEEQIKITFGNLKIENNSYLLLERTDDDSVPAIKADAVYAGALANTNEGLRLFDNECNLIDEVMAGSDWPAGLSEARRTMERQPDLSWNTYSGNGETFGGLLILGTPKKENSPVVIFQSGGATVPASPAVEPAVSAPAVELNNILISEVQITGGTGQSDNEFVELYNSNSSAIDLSALTLKLHIRNSNGTDSHKTLTFINTTIPAKGYFLIGPASGYTGVTTLDATYSASSGNKLVNNGGVYISKSASADTDILDKVGWGDQPSGGYETAVFLENPIANQSISRSSETDTNNNADDFIKSKPTPKNSTTNGGFLSPEAWAALNQLVNHIVISEIYPDRTGANRDFVELYNPNSADTGDIDISGWSLQVLSASATTTDKISKKNFIAGNKISGRRFFLIGVDNYSGADMTWASGSLNSTDGATIFLVNGTTTISGITDSRIVDRVAYGNGSAVDFAEDTPTEMPPAGQSLERGSFQSDYCLDAHINGEFLGNGCDNDNNFVDFEIRTIPNPQTAQNLPEPRTAPSLPGNFSVSYATSSAKMLLSWDASQDYNGATSTLSYSISYATSTATLKNLATVSATTTYLFKIDDVGTDYSFSILAKDSDGLSSDSADISISIPSPLADFYFYKDSRATTSKKYLFDFHYGDYPFIPNPYNNNTGRIMVFYLNKEAPNEISLNSGNHFRPENSDGAVKDGVVGIIYTKCSGDSPSSAGSPGFSLILPGPCGTNGGVQNSTLTSGSLEDLHLLFGLVKTTDDIIFTDQDFITVGMYSFYSDNGGGWQYYQLGVLDRNKYFFQNQPPSHNSPEIGGELALNFNKSTSKLETEWSKATDLDTLDIFLTYEISYDGGANWQSTDAQNKTSKVVVPGDSFSILVRAKDDFGNYSDPPLSAEWSYPATVFSVTQAQANDWGAKFGTKNENCPGCAGTASLQSIQPAEDFQFNVLTLRLWHEYGADYADAELFVYPDSNNSPDFNALIASSSIKNLLYPDKDSDIAFSFDSPVIFSGGSRYWLVLGAKYDNGNTGFYRNQWKNAINTGADLYSGGQAGRGSSGVCSDGTYCPFTVPYPDATADWYLKIGLSE